MSEQLNPTAGEEETTGQPVVEESPRAEEIAPDVEENTQTEENAPVGLAPVTSPPPTLESLDVIGSDDDGADDDIQEEGEEEDDLYVDGPAEYIEREKSGRGRRIGSEVQLQHIDYKNIPLLSRFLDRRGRILSRRKTRVSAKVQRRINQAIKRARHLSLLPYTAEQTRIVRKRR
jgi:small subunit ribosomal protein S18